MEELQRLLNKNGAGIGIDGDYGGRTERAVLDFDQSYGLPEDGKADVTTWAMLDAPPFCQDTTLALARMEPNKPLTEGSKGLQRAWNNYGGLLTEMAEFLGFKPSAAVAVLLAESSGQGFGSDGRMIIRFENHIFKKHVDAEVFKLHFKYNADKRWTGHYWRATPDGEWRRLHTSSAGQNEEWSVLAFARSLNDEGALQSISMGAPQVMGFNASLVGYSSARKMFDAWSAGEREQILGLFDFIRSNHKMVRALRTKDWVSFATRYNGSGKAEHYGQVIRDYVKSANDVGIA